MFYVFLVLSRGLNLIYYIYIYSSGRRKNRKDITHPESLSSTCISQGSPFNSQSRRTDIKKGHVSFARILFMRNTQVFSGYSC